MAGKTTLLTSGREGAVVRKIVRDHRSVPVGPWDEIAVLAEKDPVVLRPPEAKLPKAAQGDHGGSEGDPIPRRSPKAFLKATVQGRPP
jgi:hypothetical protein